MLKFLSIMQIPR